MEKRLIGIFLILSLIVAACGGSESTEQEKVPVPPSSMFMVRNYHFCSDQETDRFLLGYYGNQLSDTLVYFYIISSKGDTIFQDEWPSVEMVPGMSEPDDDAILEAMRKMIDVKPQEGEVCQTKGPTYSYSGHVIGYCEPEKAVIKI